MKDAIAALVDLPEPTGRMPFHLSPDGRLLALGVQRRTDRPRGPRFDEWGVPREMAGTSVVVVDTSTGSSTRPFPEGSESWGARWSPLGDRLAACVRHEGVACLGLWEVGTGEVELLRNAPVLVRYGFDLPVWTPDGTGIVVPLWPAGRDYLEDAHGTVPRIDVRSNDPDATTEGDPALRRWRQCDLGHVSLGTGSIRKLLQQRAASGWRVAPDGRHVACTRHVENVVSLQHSVYELFTVDMETGVERLLASNIAGAFGINYAWSPNSSSIAYSSSGRGRPDELFIVAADGSQEPVNLTPGPDFDLPAEVRDPAMESGWFEAALARRQGLVAVRPGIRPSPSRIDPARVDIAPLDRPAGATHPSTDRGRRPARGPPQRVRPEREGRPSGPVWRTQARGRYTGNVRESHLAHGGGRVFRVLLPDGGGGEPPTHRAAPGGWKP